MRGSTFDKDRVEKEAAFGDDAFAGFDAVRHARDSVVFTFNLNLTPFEDALANLEEGVALVALEEEPDLIHDTGPTDAQDTQPKLNDLRVRNRRIEGAAARDNEADDSGECAACTESAVLEKVRVDDGIDEDAVDGVVHMSILVVI